MEKYIKAIELMEHPERFTDAEIDALLEDKETQKIYETLCVVEKTLDKPQKPTDEEIDEEWERFVKREGMSSRVRPEALGWWSSKKIAAVAATFVVAAGVLALGIGMSDTTEKRSEIGEEMVCREKQKGNEVVESWQEESIGSRVDTVLFENESLEKILERVSSHYGMHLKAVEPTSLKTRLFFRWIPNESQEEVVRRLNNFEKINLSLENDTLVIF